MYEGLINNLNKAADKWEREHPIIGVGQLRVHDALRDAARALKEADCKIEQVTLERDAAVADLEHVKDCDSCKYDNACITGKKDCFGCHEKICPCLTCQYEWRGGTKEDTND